MKKNRTWLILIVMTTIIGVAASYLSFNEVIILSLCLASLSIFVVKVCDKYNV